MNVLLSIKPKHAESIVKLRRRTPLQAAGHARRRRLVALIYRQKTQIPVWVSPT